MSNNNNDIKSNAWPFQEALRILKKYEQNTSQKKDYVLFETGYGPSGLPHIGTFGEVARTTMVRNAFSKISDVPTKLIAFSDDLDGLRKLPENIPNKKLIKGYIGKPLTSIPDPYETHKSFGDHNNSKLCEFLDAFGFDYEFKSSTESYFSGDFNNSLLEEESKKLAPLRDKKMESAASATTDISPKVSNARKSTRITLTMLVPPP